MTQSDNDAYGLDVLVIFLKLSVTNLNFQDLSEY